MGGIAKRASKMKRSILIVTFYFWRALLKFPHSDLHKKNSENLRR